MTATTQPTSEVDFPDSWYLTLFAAKSMELIYTPHINDSRHAMQPFVIGTYLCITNRARVAWCQIDDYCPWMRDLLTRTGPGIDEIRNSAALMIQYSKQVADRKHCPIATEITVNDDDSASVFSERYDIEQLQLLLEGNVEVVQGDYEINGHAGKALFFRWGATGGGCVLPLAEN